MLTAHGGLDAAHDLHGAVFEHVTPRADIEPFVEDVFVFVHGEEGDFDRQPPLGCDAVQSSSSFSLRPNLQPEG